ncbi:MAG: precorrin-6y C5,15-methyltransferase (decarboxylating) subunit CbiE [Ruminococcus sp.]|nr:precorrin-6y C5,15-methyltransferase (decarboxylating) subunit CbiE [Ruminococcus sp.]
MRVFVVGIGANGYSTLTREAEQAIDQAELLIGAERMTRPFADSAKTVVNAYISQDIANVLDKSTAKTAAVLMSGDCGFFSGTKSLIPLLKGHEVTIISGISSASYFCNKIGISYENMRFISLHGRQSNIAVNVKMNENCFILLGGNMSASDVCRRLCEYGLSDVTVHIGEALGYENERIVYGKASEMCGITTDKLAVMVVENPDFLRYIPCSVNDGEFIRGNVPMTKSAVRGNIVSSLNIGKNDVCWDIGCGTGSVSVEMAFRCIDGNVYAFDKKREAIELTVQNAQKFGCDNVTAIEGICPDILQDIPAPDKVFVGGSSGNMLEIFSVIHSKNPAADVIVTAVSLETLRQTQDAFEAFGSEYDVTQLAVTETRKIGGYTMLNAQNPIFIFRGKLQ